MKHLNLINKAFLLQKTTLFGKLDLDLLLTISDKMEMVQFREKEKIFQCDQEAYKMYLVIEGTVAIHNRERILLAELGRGEFFGDEALFNEQLRGYGAEATGPTTLLSLSRTHLLSILMECPQVSIALLEAYTANIAFRERDYRKR